MADREHTTAVRSIAHAIDGLRSGEAWSPDPYRVEIKQSASGAVQVSTRATAQDADDAVEEAVRMYRRTLERLREADED